MNVCFITGCARSGTSVLGELLASHADVRYVFEWHSLWEIGQGEGVEHHLRGAEEATPLVRREIRRRVQEAQGPARLFVEKSPRNILRIPFLRAVFPEARLIHIVRDGRDAACSLLPGCGGNAWGHLKPPHWLALFSQYAGVERCASLWRDVVARGLEDLSRGDQLLVRYEDLVARPWAEAERILHYARLSHDRAVEAYCGRIQNATAHGQAAAGQSRWSRDDHRARVGRWRENLSLAEQEWITEFLQPLLVRLGYSSAAEGGRAA